MKKRGNFIEFNFDKVKVNLRHRRALKIFITNMIVEEGRELETLSFTFLSDKALLKMNRSYLNHDFYTDILTFDLSTRKKSVSGDIYISIERVTENALTNSTSVTEELHRVIFHGVLHLLGYKDKSHTQIVKMKQKEEFYLNAYFVPRETNR